MTERMYHPRAAALARTRTTFTQYQDLYQRSVSDPEAFWKAEASRLDWLRSPSIIRNVSFETPVSIRWFEDGELNASTNCIDRHLANAGDTPAIIWEPDNPADDAEIITYRQLHSEVGMFANVLLSLGVSKGDRVTIYMPMVPEAVYAMLACARIGAVHCVVFGGFSPSALADRINDSGSRVVVTAASGQRGGRVVPLKTNVDAALRFCPAVRKVVVVPRGTAEIKMVAGRDVWFDKAAADVSSVCQPERMNAEDPLFILYTSGSTGKPKGVVHTTGGYLVWTSLTHERVFDYRPGDVFWCTADVGWITGHSYLVYGPLANGATVVMFEGVPTWPQPDRMWQVIERHKVNIFYTAPTAIRGFMAAGERWTEGYDLSSLRLLGSVGEPINPEAWLWYREKIGKGRCEVVDTWWQTETGGFMIAPMPGAIPTKPGSATVPLFGVEPVILSPEGVLQEEIEAEGILCFSGSWPGQARTIHGDHPRFVATYFEPFRGYYFTGDGCRRDADGYYWITGRVDDVLNVSGHRMGTAEIESALVSHPLVSEAAVVGRSHPLKGEAIYCFVTLVDGAGSSDNLVRELRQLVRDTVGPIATPDTIQWARELPKTRSGKILRRLLRKIAEGTTESLGDTSTLANPHSVEQLIAGREQATGAALMFQKAGERA
jgi:acetyl-CoA synthetase